MNKPLAEMQRPSWLDPWEERHSEGTETCVPLEKKGHLMEMRWPPG
jgi:hypothetical protein